MEKVTSGRSPLVVSLLVGLAAAVGAALIYGVIWWATGRGSTGKLLLTFAATLVVAGLIRFAFASYYDKRRSPSR